MKIQDIIRGMIDLVDNVEQGKPQVMPKATNTILSPLSCSGSAGDDINRFKQIVDLVDNPERDKYCNEPKPVYSGLDAVTIHAGGGLNGPKQLSDIRVKDQIATPHLIYQQDPIANNTFINFLRGL